METPAFNLEPVIARLRAAGPQQWERIARESGVPESTIKKIAYRETRNPGVLTAQKLASYFERV